MGDIATVPHSNSGVSACRAASAPAPLSAEFAAASVVEDRVAAGSGHRASIDVPQPAFDATPRCPRRRERYPLTFWYGIPCAAVGAGLVGLAVALRMGAQHRGDAPRFVVPLLAAGGTCLGLTAVGAYLVDRHMRRDIDGRRPLLDPDP